MTKYWIDLVECQRVVNELNTLMESVGTDFDKIDGDSDLVRESLCVSDESNDGERQAKGLDSSIEGLLTEDLREHYDGIVAEIRTNINAMQDVINYYAFGDAQMAHDAAGTESDMPEFIYTSDTAAGSNEAGYVPGHPARGNVAADSVEAQPEYVPGHPAQGLAGHDGTTDTGEVLSDEYATRYPFAVAKNTGD